MRQSARTDSDQALQLRPKAVVTNGRAVRGQDRRRRSRIRIGRALVAAFLLGAHTGCYAYAPIAAAPALGTTVSFQITDAGRVSLGSALGSGAEQIEGVIDERNDSAYVLRMRSVTYINGQSNQWSNERIVVGKQYVTNAKERRFSKGRTALVAAGAVAGVLAFIASRSLLGLGSDRERGPGGGGEPQ